MESSYPDGWYYQNELRYLSKIAESPWCEIGCWRGRSTSVLAKKGPGYAVDAFKGSPEHGLEHNVRGVYDAFMRNVGGMPHVTVLQGHFRDMAELVPNDLAFLHIDHDHTYEPTAEAFRLYAPKLRPGGHVVFHDAVWDKEGNPWPGVTKFAAEIDWPRLEDVGRCATFRCPT